MGNKSRCYVTKVCWQNVKSYIQCFKYWCCWTQEAISICFIRGSCKIWGIIIGEVNLWMTTSLLISKESIQRFLLLSSKYVKIFIDDNFFTDKQWFDTNCCAVVSYESEDTCGCHFPYFYAILWHSFMYCCQARMKRWQLLIYTF